MLHSGLEGSPWLLPAPTMAKETLGSPGSWAGQLAPDSTLGTCNCPSS